MDTTPVLGLRSAIGTDPFLRADFVFNWGALDAAPGVAKGSSADRSALTWGSGQGGRLFLEEETQRLMQWTGTAWVELLQNSESFGASIVSPTLATPAAGSSATYAFPAITLIRPGRLVGSMSLTWLCPLNHTPYISNSPYVDGVGVAPMNGTYRSTPPATTGNAQGVLTVPFRTGVLSAGSHTPQIRVSSQTGNGATCYQASYTAVVAN
jgi:hypothetical protein